MWRPRSTNRCIVGGSRKSGENVGWVGKATVCIHVCVCILMCIFNLRVHNFKFCKFTYRATPEGTSCRRAAYRTLEQQPHTDRHTDTSHTRAYEYYCRVIVLQLKSELRLRLCQRQICTGGKGHLKTLKMTSSLKESEEFAFCSFTYLG